MTHSMSLLRVSGVTRRICKQTIRECRAGLPLLLQAANHSTKNMNVYVTRNVPVAGLEMLKSASLNVTQWEHEEVVPRGELLSQVKQADGLFCLLTDRIDAELLDSAGKMLKVVGTMSVGYDHIDVGECKKRDIKVGYTPDVLTHATAELTVALLLATSRRLVEGVQAVKDGAWGTWQPTWLCGPSLQNSTVGIFGFGRIGQAVVKSLSGFGLGRVIYTNHHQVSHLCAERVNFEQLLQLSDFVIVCAALNESTHGIFDTNVFQKMKKTAILINTARGPIVKMNDLADALESKEIAAAGLDVTEPEPIPLDHKLVTLNNCVILPHIGSATNEARSAMSRLTAQNIIAALQGKEMPAQV